MQIDIKAALKEHGSLLVIQSVSVLLIWKMFGAGPGIVVGLMLGGVIYGLWKESREPGVLMGFYGNWKRAFAASALLSAIAVFVGIPLLALAIMLTPTAAADWQEALNEYGLTGGQMLIRVFFVGILTYGFIAFAHLIFTRIAFKIVAVMKRPADS
jgi:hypothetical protein